MKYRLYKIFIQMPCCKTHVEVASFDYFSNAFDRKEELVHTFGKDKVMIKTVIKERIC